ncbi:hypothetical protein HAX54_039005, partial [Datura stramonium]|nr:hypothetical protein [Datura stramonium]
AQRSSSIMPPKFSSLIWKYFELVQNNEEGHKTRSRDLIPDTSLQLLFPAAACVDCCGLAAYLQVGAGFI